MNDNPDRRIFVNGCFDIIHVGHVRLLRAAASLGKLTVAINSDDVVRKLKGEYRPVNGAVMRREVLLGIKGVEEVMVFLDDDPTEILIRMYDEGKGPDMVVKSDEYANKPIPEHAIVTSNGGVVLLYCSHLDVSTSQMVDLIEKQSFAGSRETSRIPDHSRPEEWKA